MTFSFHKLARMLATAGLQISQPFPLPWLARSSPKDLICLILMISNNSCRVNAKCSHRLLLSFLPDFFISALNRSITSGKQPPQPVPAFVHFFTSSTDARPLSRMLEQMVPLLTLLQEHTWASSGMASRAFSLGT